MRLIPRSLSALDLLALADGFHPTRDLIPRCCVAASKEVAGGTEGRPAKLSSAVKQALDEH